MHNHYLADQEMKHEATNETDNRAHNNIFQRVYFLVLNALVKFKGLPILQMSLYSLYWCRVYLTIDDTDLGDDRKI